MGHTGRAEGGGEAAGPGDESSFWAGAGVTWEPTQTRAAPLPPTCPVPRFQQVSVTFSSATDHLCSKKKQKQGLYPKMFTLVIPHWLGVIPMDIKPHRSGKLCSQIRLKIRPRSLRLLSEVMGTSWPKSAYVSPVAWVKQAQQNFLTTFKPGIWV